MAKRINNILRDQPAAKVNPDLFVEKEERDLYSAFSIIEHNAAPMIARGDFGRAQGIIFKLQPVLNTFFDRVLVMAEEKKLRQNRLGLLQAIAGCWRGRPITRRSSWKGRGRPARRHRARY